MILGIGNDIVEIERIRNVLERHYDKFLNRIFTPYEIEYCQKFSDPATRFAGRFVGKEAVSKALGTGFIKGVSWLDIEIRHDEKMKPVVLLSPSIISICGELEMLVSISHCHSYATATAISYKT